MSILPVTDISELSITDTGNARDIALGRRRQIRDRLLAILREAGRPMAPLELAHASGLGVCAVTRCADSLRSYFRLRRGVKRIETIDIHPHLKIYP